MEILRILVQHQLSELLHRKLISWPDLGNIERIETELLRIRIFGLHDLHLGSPLELLASFNTFPKLLLGLVRVDSRHLDGLVSGKLLLAVLGDEVVLNVDELALLVDPLESVTAVAVVVCPAIGSAVVGEEHEPCMIAFGSVAEEVKGCVVVEEEVLGITGLRADDIWTLNWVSAEEDGKVQPHDVVVSLPGVELDSKTSRVAGFIWELSSKCDSRETNEDWCSGSGLLQEVRLGKV